MCDIDYDLILERPDVRAKLGKERVERAEEDPDYLPQLVRDEENTVLTLSWDGDAPGCSGANWVTEWNGLYFVTSSDTPRSGPFESLDDALGDERFWIETSHPELQSDVLPAERLLAIGGALAGQDGLDVFINGRRFVRRRGELVDATRRRRASVRGAGAV